MTLLTVMATTVCCYRPAYRWVAETVENNILLSLTISVLLLFKFVLSRIYYVSCIQEGNVKARGCAGSSCLLTLLMAVFIVILTMKACRLHHKPACPEQAVKEQACSPTPDPADKSMNESNGQRKLSLENCHGRSLKKRFNKNVRKYGKV